MELPDPQIVYIEWLDIHTHTGDHDSQCVWVPLPDSTRPSLCRSVGWLLHEDKEAVQFAATVSDEDGERSALVTCTIPRGCIKKMKRINPKRLK